MSVNLLHPFQQELMRQKLIINRIAVLIEEN